MSPFSVHFLLIGNHGTEMPLGNTRLYKRFKAVKDCDGTDQETVTSLIDAMIANRQSPIANRQTVNGKR